MSTPDRLHALARIQHLREQRQFAHVAQVSAEFVAARGADESAAEAEVAAHQQHSMLFTEARICLDRLGLANALLTHTAVARAGTRSAMAAAQQNDRHAREVLQQEKVRSGHLADKAKAARRKYADKLEVRQLSAARSLRAALNQGDQP